ncbi:conserved exported hypothetical protein [uncultured Pleomorphomonas sp.]|uniref:Mannosyl-glycoprotein endo-beta-N-acetylglucosamidase-like domain-containing protein n=1 Tax=uncultured Pleomorphomonas sp. TaxID=442121 RepID=A0A212LPX8_9HYPH|nr:glucosaminidase domain-containing protein [uncultured Pleomorphomonas sp.]SCM79566.1 conserved exported hypothetical protein [uncultured Pleomorphomonas sp.]
MRLKLLGLKKYTAALLLMFSCSLPATAQSTPDPANPNWGCYDPAPGHPSAQEKLRFVVDVSTIAKKAEAKYGVPAAPLAAMAIVESGYGWTRTALLAHNYFGWKAKEGSSGAYMLACQPTDSDPNAYYKKYDSIEASVMAVAENLANSPNYKIDTKRYAIDLAAGVAPDQAARLWIDAIAPRYNGNPPEYRRTLRRFMNDPISPGETVNSSDTLYALLPAAAATNRFADIEGSVAYKAALSAVGAKLEPGSRYTDNCLQGSGTISKEYKGYEGYPVKRCVYVQGELTGLNYTMHPSKEQLSRWIAYACIRTGTKKQADCGTTLFNELWDNNNAQFNVAGNVIEKGKAANCDEPSILYNIEFRDGVTVKLASETFICLKGARSIAQQEADAVGIIEKYRNWARVAALHINVYDKITGKKLTDLDQQKPWGKYSQLVQLTAWDDGVNALLNVKAESIYGIK